MVEKKTPNNPLPIICISFLLSFIIWIVVINIQSPVHTQVIKNNSIVFNGLDSLEELSVLVQNTAELNNQKVKVKLKGPRLKIEEILDNPSLLSISMNLSEQLPDGISPAFDQILKTVPIKIESKLPGVTIESFSPKEVGVVFERKVSKTLPIEVQSSKNIYQLEEGYLPPFVNPTNVIVSGGVSKIESIYKAVVEIDEKSSYDNGITYTLPVVLLDQSGREIEGVEIEPDSVQVTIPIGDSKMVPIVPSIDKSSIKDTYGVLSVVPEIEEIFVVGPPEIIESLEEIQTTLIDLTNVTENISVESSIILPEGVYSPNTKTNIRVDVGVSKKNTYDLRLNTNALSFEFLNLKEGLAAKVLTSQLKVQLYSVPEKVLEFNKDTLIATVDLLGLPPGVHKVKVNLEEKEGFDSVIVDNIEIEIREKN